MYSRKKSFLIQSLECLLSDSNVLARGGDSNALVILNLYLEVKQLIAYLDSQPVSQSCLQSERLAVLHYTCQLFTGEIQLEEYQTMASFVHGQPNIQLKFIASMLFSISLTTLLVFFSQPKYVSPAHLSLFIGLSMFSMTGSVIAYMKSLSHGLSHHIFRVSSEAYQVRTIRQRAVSLTTVASARFFTSNNAPENEPLTRGGYSNTYGGILLSEIV